MKKRPPFRAANRKVGLRISFRLPVDPFVAAVEVNPVVRVEVNAVDHL